LCERKKKHTEANNTLIRTGHTGPQSTSSPKFCACGEEKEETTKKSSSTIIFLPNKTTSTIVD